MPKNIHIIISELFEYIFLIELYLLFTLNYPIFFFILFQILFGLDNFTCLLPNYLNIPIPSQKLCKCENI